MVYWYRGIGGHHDCPSAAKSTPFKAPTVRRQEAIPEEAGVSCSLVFQGCGARLCDSARWTGSHQAFCHSRTTTRILLDDLCPYTARQSQTAPRGVVGRGRGRTPSPTFLRQGDASPTPPLFGLKLAQKLVHSCNWLLTETQCKIISVQQN